MKIIGLGLCPYIKYNWNKYYLQNNPFQMKTDWLHLKYWVPFEGL